MTLFWTPPENPDHTVEISDPNDISTWVVRKGTKTAKQLVSENLENPNREDHTELLVKKPIYDLKYGIDIKDVLK